MSSYHGWTHAQKADGGTDPIPIATPVFSQWISLQNGGTTAPHNTVMPIPFAELVYDPTLGSQGGASDTFDWTIIDTGDAGNDRFQLRTNPEGFYEFHLRTAWDQMNTNGTEPFAYYQQQLTIRNISDTTTFYDNAASADWLRDDVEGNTSDGPGEQSANRYLNLTDIVYLAGSRIWKPVASQTTGVDRGLSSEQLFVRFLSTTDSSVWTTELV